MSPNASVPFDHRSVGNRIGSLTSFGTTQERFAATLGRLGHSHRRLLSAAAATLALLSLTLQGSVPARTLALYAPWLLAAAYGVVCLVRPLPQPSARAAALSRTERWVGALACAAIATLALALRLYRIGARSLWLDEAASVWAARLPWHDLLPTLSVHDGNPPLYYALLHLWMVVSAGEAWLRLLSALCSLAAVALGAALATRVGGRAAGWIAALLLAASPVQVHYAQEARTYALLAALTLAATFASVQLLTHPARRRSFVVGAILATMAAAHNTAGLVAAALLLAAFITTLIQRRIAASARVLLAGLIAAVLWAPLLPLTLSQARLVAGHFWIPRPTPEYAVGELLSASASGPPPASHIQISEPISVGRPEDVVPALLSVPRIPPLQTLSRALNAHSDLIVPALGAMLLLALGAIRSRSGTSTAALIGAAVLLPPLALWLVSQVRPVLIGRAMVGSGTLALVAFAVGCAALPRWLRPVPAALALCLQLLSLGEHWWYPSGEDWRAAAAHLAAQARTGDVVLLNSRWAQLPLDYYVPAQQRAALRLRGVPVDFAVRGLPEPEVTLDDLAALHQVTYPLDHVWLVLSHSFETDPAGLTRKTLEADFPCYDVWPFEGVTVLRFSRCAE